MVNGKIIESLNLQLMIKNDILWRASVVFLCLLQAELFCYIFKTLFLCQIEQADTMMFHMLTGRGRGNPIPSLKAATFPRFSSRNQLEYVVAHEQTKTKNTELYNKRSIAAVLSYSITSWNTAVSHSHGIHNQKKG